MDWSDEHYVKLYTRDSLTWRSWKWETRTTFLHLVRKVDGSGFIESGRMDPVDALVLQLDLPKSVVSVGLEQLVADETCESTDRAIFLINFVAAQEARKTEAQKKRDYREKIIIRRRMAQTNEITTAHVPTMSPPCPLVGTLQLSPAQPSPDKDLSFESEHPIQTAWNAGRKAPIPKWSATKGARKKSADARFAEHPDPEFWRTLMARICRSDFLSGRKNDFRASPDWILKPANLTKVLEGNYDGGGPIKGSAIHTSTKWGPDDDFLAGLTGALSGES